MPNYNVVSNEKFPDAEVPYYLEIAEGQFQGTCFVFGPIQFVGEDEDGSGRISFDYSLLHLDAAHSLTEEPTKIALEDEIGKILHVIIEESIAREKAENEDPTPLDEDHRNADSV